MVTRKPQSHHGKAVLFVLLLCTGWLPMTNSKTQMFDLKEDPNESESTHGDTTYDDVKLYMESRIPGYWVSAITEPDNSDNPGETVIKQQWDNCHATCPWTLNTASYEIEHKFSYPNAPHIVFILVDDWGYNDAGYRSTSMKWTTPVIDKLASEGIILNNYFTHESCTPSRGALMTGRVAIRLGLQGAPEDFGPELPLSEVTLAQELKSAGYKTNLVGKWHLGMSSAARTPTYRGFDYFYGFFNSYMDYYTKMFDGYIALHEGLEPVMDSTALDATKFSQHLFQEKAENVIKSHATAFATYPMFLLYSLQIVHAPYEVPVDYTSRCTKDGNLLDDDKYCGMNVMLDEAVANITCALAKYGMSENTVLIVASDNGGAQTATAGTNVPYRGYKGDYWRGAMSVNAFIHSPLIPVNARGTQYDGQMHVSDWLPTLMGLATKNTWTGSLAGPDIVIDGQDMWEAIVTGGESPRHEILHMIKAGGETYAIQYDMVKLDMNNDVASFGTVSITYASDFAPQNKHTTCEGPSMMVDSAGGLVQATDDNFGGPTLAPSQKASEAPTLPKPTTEPTLKPTSTVKPTAVIATSPPSFRPVSPPTLLPSWAPISEEPSPAPTEQPSVEVTEVPTLQPTAEATNPPTIAPSREPTSKPSYPETSAPSQAPSKITPVPTATPPPPPPEPSTQIPTGEPSYTPSYEPSPPPSSMPTPGVKLFITHNKSYLILGAVFIAWVVYFVIRYCPSKCCLPAEDQEPVKAGRGQANDKTPLLGGGHGMIIKGGSELSPIGGWRAMG